MESTAVALHHLSAWIFAVAIDSTSALLVCSTKPFPRDIVSSMFTPEDPNLDFTELRDAYKQDLAAAWALWRRKHRDHAPYAFVLWGLEGGNPPRFMPCVLTEENLTRVAQRYVDKEQYKGAV